MSPLARGLRLDPNSPVTGFRIIPARAGFTSRCRWRPWWPSDQPRSRGVYATHEVLGSTTAYPDQPRSRGVYRMSVQPVMFGAGSAPLARGLPPVPGHAGERSGIIPARAGFTLQDAALLAVRLDHPRSRGVYSSGCLASQRRAGSSPLARGLPDRGPHRRPEAGIIPARAGFTSGAPPDPGPSPDHPRSRGVYSTSAVAASTSFGSSPLARGLPQG